MSEAAFCSSCGTRLTAGVSKGLCARCLLKRGMEAPTAGFEETGESTRHWEPPALAEITAQMPGIEVIELLGRGGMGAVYKARQTQLDRIVALKILPPDIGLDPAFAERFAREAKALARLNHPNIVTLYEFGKTIAGLYYFLMEYVDGVNLRALMDGKRLAPREALAIVPQVCDALQYAHDNGIVHRDIKPENILLDRRGRVKVADFGLAKIAGQDEAMNPDAAVRGGAVLTEAGKVVGTPQYMAPEQETSPGRVDHRADIYALGVVFYQMLTGELPARPAQPPSRKIELDVRLDEIVLRALERDPEQRYAQASVMKTRVETIDLTSGLAVAEPAPARAAKRVKAPGIALMAVAGVTLVQTVYLGIHPPAFHDGYPANRYTLYLLVRIAASLFVAWGANLMRRLKGFEAAIMAPTVTLLCAIRLHGAWWLGLPVAVWAFIVLFDSHREFEQAGSARQATRVPQSPIPNPSIIGGSSFPQQRSIYPTPSPVSYVALVFACLSGIIPTIFYWYAPFLLPSLTAQGQQRAIWATLGAAILAITLGLASRATRLGKWSAIYGGISLTIWMIFFVAGNFYSPFPGIRTDASTIPASPIKSVASPGVTQFGFGPVTELQIKELDGADLDAGKVIRLPESFIKNNDILLNPNGVTESILNAVAWMESRGVDVFGDSRTHFFGIKLRTLSQNKSAWNEFPASKVMSDLDASITNVSTYVPMEPLTVGTPYVFQTHKGGRGMLQILDANGEAVKLQYKLVQKLSGDAHLTGPR